MIKIPSNRFSFTFALFYLAVNLSEINAKPRIDNVCSQYYEFGHHSNNFNVLECETVEIIAENISTSDSTNFDNFKLDVKRLKDGSSLVSLSFQRSDRILATKNTPVWFGISTFDGKMDVTYDKLNISTVAPELDFKMFQNYDKKSAVVVFAEKSQWIVEGFIGNHYLKRHMNGQYVYLKVSFPEMHKMSACKRNCKPIKENFPIELSSSLEAIYPEILVALDWDSTKDKYGTEIIKDVLVYYNAVDMLFSQFQSPKIQLHIAGIVIPMDYSASPYFSKVEEDSDNGYVSYNPIHDRIRQHFMMYRDTFPMEDYDIVMGMSTVPFCDADENCNFYGVSYQSADCQGKNLQKFGPIVGAVRHPSFFGRYALVAKEIAHMLGGNYIREWDSSCCNGILSEFVDPSDSTQWPLEWSECTRRNIAIYFQLNVRSVICMRNEPKELNKTKMLSVTTSLPCATESHKATEAIISIVSTEATEITTTTEATEATEAVSISEINPCDRTTEMTTITEPTERTLCDKASEIVTTTEMNPCDKLTEATTSTEVTERIPCRKVTEATTTTEATVINPCDKTAETTTTTKTTETTPCGGRTEISTTSKATDTTERITITEATETTPVSKVNPCHEITEITTTTELAETTETTAASEVNPCHKATEITTTRTIETTELVKPMINGSIENTATNKNDNMTVDLHETSLMDVMKNYTSRFDISKSTDKYNKSDPDDTKMVKRNATMPDLPVPSLSFDISVAEKKPKLLNIIRNYFNRISNFFSCHN